MALPPLAPHTATHHSRAMPAPFDLVLPLHGPDATAALAASIAPLCRAGDVIALWGGIGAGKSHFARALIATRLAAAGRAEDIPSPTFTLVQTYDADEIEIWHSDLYRLTHADEVLELGLEDAFDSALCLIEWPDRLGSDLPGRALHLRLDPGSGPDDRIARLHAMGGGWADRLAPIRDRATVAHD
ncbi:tRNA (adenosine(37)-N6)-threonylcarbamoyltransferase complex ATPase subunit type 1 TsaE [Meridianimarinicoccus zhengii]|uniref:tRNA (adenosine(37)-N6)-threonylcarbamoyltransferase complex ATPase subunit type 1 TsaE n=1 Tax=Meridianimarinicoccus zhengii TaxID=2056810 RepID=UPI003742C685